MRGLGGPDPLDRVVDLPAPGPGGATVEHLIPGALRVLQDLRDTGLGPRPAGTFLARRLRRRIPGEVGVEPVGDRAVADLRSRLSSGWGLIRPSISLARAAQSRRSRTTADRSRRTRSPSAPQTGWTVPRYRRRRLRPWVGHCSYRQAGSSPSTSLLSASSNASGNGVVIATGSSPAPRGSALDRPPCNGR